MAREKDRVLLIEVSMKMQHLDSEVAYNAGLLDWPLYWAVLLSGFTH